jgi:DNA-binding NarL/FixJ family response regulator
MASLDGGKVGEGAEKAGGGLRVLVAGNDPLARSGLASLLGHRADLQVVAQSELTQELARQLLVNRPQVMAWDLGADAKSALILLRELADPETPVLALLADESHASEALDAGARGLVARDADPARMAAALQGIAHGLLVVDESLSSTALRIRPTSTALDLDPLTPRELEALQLLAQAKSNKEIAHQLGISEHTAKFHVNAILNKLGVQSRTEAVIVAARRGLVIL